MGLFTVKRVVERHGGEIEVKSELGLGSRFIIRLPRTLKESEDAVTTAIEGGRALHGKLLLVEDDPGIRELARKILENAGLQVISVADGQAAMDQWKSQKDQIDLLLTDLVLPGTLSGRDVAKAVLAERPEIPVIYMSGFADEGDDNPFLTPTNFMRKPFSPVTLKQMVSAALR